DKEKKQGKKNEQANRNDQPKPRLGIFKVLKLAGPNQAIAARQLDVLRDPSLRLGDRAAEIAIAHAELHRNVALALLVIDIRGAGIETDVGKFAEPNIGVGAAGIRNRDFDIADGFETRAIFGRQADRHAELAIALQQSGRGGAAQSRLDDRIHVASVKAVTGGFGAVDLDIEIWLAEHMEDAEIGDAGHLLHFMHDV